MSSEIRLHAAREQMLKKFEDKVFGLFNVSRHSDSEQLFGIVSPVDASSTDSIDAVTADADPTKLVTLAKGLSAHVLSAQSNLGPNIDQMVLWPAGPNPTHIIACNEEGTAQPGLQRVRLSDGLAQTIMCMGPGKIAFTRSLTMGTAEAVYFEDNEAHFSPEVVNLTGNNPWIVPYQGARIVIRHNKIINTQLEIYRLRPGAYGCQSAEIYDNAFSAEGALILKLQGDGDYAGVGALYADFGKIDPTLQGDLDRLKARGIPVDIIYDQGR